MSGKIPVAAYCRVSTDREDQASSFDSQQRFFRRYIAQRPEWTLWEIYADEGLSGTSTRNRAAFNRMMDHARQGRFTLLLTKEVSRFSRNILDTIACTRELRALGVGVVFLADGISTLDADAELRLSIMGSIAQEESRRTSQRVKWGQQRRMEQGSVFGRAPLGYRRAGTTLAVDPEEAEVVRLIFHRYAREGKSPAAIARELEERGCPTGQGGSRWSAGSLAKILRNEKYVGDLVQKKTITPDYLTHARRPNRGEEALVVLQDHHPAIISRELWEETAAELERRRAGRGGPVGRYPLSGKVWCGVCGGPCVARRRKGREGAVALRWGCARACARGRQGCTLGWSIGDGEAMELVRRAAASLKVDWRREGEAVLRAVETAGDMGEKEKLLRHIAAQRRALAERRRRAAEAMLAGELDREELALVRAHCAREEARLAQRMEEEKGRGALENALRALAEGEEGRPILPALLAQLRLLPGRKVEVALRGQSGIWKFQGEK